MNDQTVIILGGGISGLTTAWYLKKAGIPVLLIEKNQRAGGLINSELIDENVLDFGPNSLRDKTGVLRELSSDLGLDNDVLITSEAFKIRYIVKNGKTTALTHPFSLVSSGLISTKAFFRMLGEVFIKKGKPEEESLASFFERRLGKEPIDFLLDPFFSGIYAGDIHKLSIQALFPEMAEMEQEYGSLTKAALKKAYLKKGTHKNHHTSETLNFRKGIQQLTDRLQEKLGDVIIHETIVSVFKPDENYRIQTESNMYTAPQVVSCLPAYELAHVLKEMDASLSEALGSVVYSPILSTHLIFNKSDVKTPMEGFGFLVPRNENIRILGSIWKSSIFPDMAQPDKLVYTLMTGGRHDEKIRAESIESVESQIMDEFSKLMGISAKPVFKKSKLVSKAIPQFEIGYSETLKKIKSFEISNHGFIIGGNFVWGVSVPDCIQSAKQCSQNIIPKHSKNFHIPFTLPN